MGSGGPGERVLSPGAVPRVGDLRPLLPPAAEVIDAHTHLGRDEDGHSLAPEELLAALDAAGVARACVFALHDPERRPAYRVPNDRVLAWAAASGGRLVPFCRLDPDDGAVPEAERCLARGARGIKLHPRAQAFGFDHRATGRILALAEEAGLPVLVHAGRGLPPIAEELARVALRHPRLVLVLAHAGIADQALFSSLLAEHPGVLYDTSAFSALDVLALLARVPAERVVFGSDPPYGAPLPGLYVTLRCCAAAGLGERAVRAVLGETLSAALAGRALPEPGPPAGEEHIALPAPLLRVHSYAMMAFGAALAGLPAPAREGVDLALSACRDPRAGAAREALDRIAPLLQAASARLGERGGADGALRLLYVAAGIAVTPGADAVDAPGTAGHPPSPDRTGTSYPDPA